MKNLVIKRPVGIKNTDENTINDVLTHIVEEYTDFDIKLMNKYFKTKDLDESNFINI